MDGQCVFQGGSPTTQCDEHCRATETTPETPVTPYYCGSTAYSPNNLLVVDGDHSVDFLYSGCADGGTCYSCEYSPAYTAWSCGRSSADYSFDYQFPVKKNSIASGPDLATFQNVVCDMTGPSGTKPTSSDVCLGYAELDLDEDGTDEQYDFCTNNLDCGAVAVKHDGTLFYFSHSGWIMDYYDQNAQEMKIGTQMPVSADIGDIDPIELTMNPSGPSMTTGDGSHDISRLPSRFTYQDLPGAYYSLEYSCSDDDYIYFPVPLVQPGCLDSICDIPPYDYTRCRWDSIAAGMYCMCPNCEPYCEANDGSTISPMASYDEFLDIMEHSCPRADEYYSPSYLHQVYYQPYHASDICIAELEEYMKNICIYGETCGNPYNVPFMTDKVYYADEEICTCDASLDYDGQHYADCRNGYCSNLNRGLLTGADCDPYGWSTTGYIEARITEVGVFNSAGNYKQYHDCNSNTRYTTSSDCSDRGGNVGFNNDSDRVMIEVVVENTGTEDIDDPFVMVTHGGLDIDMDVGASKFTDLTSVSNDAICSIVDRGVISCVTNTGGTIEWLDGTTQLAPFGGGKLLGFWSGKTNAVARTANMEKVFESDTEPVWDGILTPGENVTFTLSMPASEWDRTIELYFYDIGTSLTQPPAPAKPYDYLTRFDFNGNFDNVLVYDMEFTEVHTWRVVTEIEQYSLCDRCSGDCTCDSCYTSYSLCGSDETCDGYGNCVPSGGFFYTPFAIAPFSAVPPSGDGQCPSSYTFNPSSCECERTYTISCAAGYYKSGCDCVPYVSSIASDSEIDFTGTLSPNASYRIDCEDFDGVCGTSPVQCDIIPSGSKGCDDGYTALGCDGSMLVCEQVETLTCTDCLYCFASRLDSDSFDVVWTSTGQSQPTDAVQNFYPSLHKINSWTGFYFLPRAYGITLDANLNLVRGETAISSTFNDSFSAVISAHGADVLSFMTSQPDVNSEPVCESTTLSSDYIFEMDTTEEPLTLKLLERQAYSPPLFNVTMNFDGTLYQFEVDGTLDMGLVAASEDPYEAVLLGPAGQRLSDYTLMLFSLTEPEDATCGECDTDGFAGVCYVEDEIGRCVNSSGMQCLSDGFPVTPNCSFGYQLSGCACQGIVNVTSNITDADGITHINIGKDYDVTRAVVRKIGGTVPVSGATVKLHYTSTAPGTPPTCDSGYTLNTGTCECGTTSSARCEPPATCTGGVCSDSSEPVCPSGQFVTGTCNCLITEAPACGSGHILQGCECVLTESHTKDDETNGDGIVTFTLDELEDLNSASVFVFDDSDNFASAMDIDVLWKINCTADCETTSLSVSPILEIRDEGNLFDGYLKVIEYECANSPGCGILNEYDTVYSVIGGEVTLGARGSFENNFGETADAPNFKQFLLEFYAEDPDVNTDRNLNPLILGTVLDVYYDNETDKTYITNDPIIIVDTVSTGTFVGRDTCNVHSSVRIPREITVLAPDCASIVVYNGLEAIPHQVLSSGDSQCKIVIVPDTSTTSVDVYYGTGFPEISYETSWGSMLGDNSRYVIENTLVNATYSLSCWDRGPCISNLTVVPDTSPNGTGWVGKGIMWDDTESENQEVEFTVDGPLKKCMSIRYNSSAPYFVDCSVYLLDQSECPSVPGSRYQTVEREICVYKDIPALFENFHLLDTYPSNQPPVEHTIFQSAYPATPLTVYSSGLSAGSYSTDGDSGQVSGDGAVWANLFGVFYNVSSKFSYSLDIRPTVVSDAYLSDLWTSHREIYSQLPDSLDMLPSDDYILDYETISFCTPDRYRCESAGINNNGSMQYYASTWLHSGTTSNCEGYSEGYENVFGTTCGTGMERGELEISLGIQRTGSHLLRFSTVEEEADIDSPDITLRNSMGGEARLVEPFTCGISNNDFSCVMDKDEKDIMLNLDRQGYVINCMVDSGSYKHLNTRYFNPYMMPMSWEVQFDIIVNPYIRQPVPIYVEERQSSLAATTCGDWICQDNERCYTCPADCPPVDVQFEPTLTTGGG